MVNVSSRTLLSSLEVACHRQNSTSRPSKGFVFTLLACDRLAWNHLGLLLFICLLLMKFRSPELWKFKISPLHTSFFRVVGLVYNIRVTALCLICSYVIRIRKWSIKTTLCPANLNTNYYIINSDIVSFFCMAVWKLKWRQTVLYNWTKHAFLGFNYLKHISWSAHSCIHYLHGTDCNPLSWWYVQVLMILKQKIMKTNFTIQWNLSIADTTGT